jgi:hypothetical protein
MMMTRERTVVIWGVALLLVFGSLACSVGGEVYVEQGTSQTEKTTAEVTDTPEVAEATKAPSPTDTLPPPTETQPAEIVVTKEIEEATVAPPTLPPETVGEKEPLEVAEIPELEVPEIDPQSGGLGHLGTFRQRMTIDFTADDTGYTSILNYNAEVNTDQQAVHIALSAEGPAAAELPANTIEVIWIGTSVWVKIGNQAWFPVPEAVEELPFDEQALAIGDFIPYVQYFQRVDERAMNGVPCAYYTYTADNVPTEYGTVSGTGDICVALDGGYVVHYTFDGHATFTDEEFFQGSGALALVYDTYDVGAPIDIKPPRGR